MLLRICVLADPDTAATERPVAEPRNLLIRVWVPCPAK